LKKKYLKTWTIKVSNITVYISIVRYFGFYGVLEVKFMRA